jgi:hypothetical protein
VDVLQKQSLTSILQMPVAMTMCKEKQGQNINCTNVKQVAEARKF